MLALVLVALAAMALATPAHAKTFTALTAEAFYGNGETIFKGSVISVKKACANKRLVTVFRKRPGADQKIGSAKAKGTTLSYWGFTKVGMLGQGTYYAVAKATGQCSAGRSIGYSGPG